MISFFRLLLINFLNLNSLSQIMQHFLNHTYVFLFCLLISQSVFAQIPTCGITELDRLVTAENLLKTRADSKNFTYTRGSVNFVPVYFHLIAKSDGTGRVAEYRVLDMLCGWNKFYANNGLTLQFYFKGFNYINSDAAYNTPRSLGGDAVIREAKQGDGMNVFITSVAGQTPNDGVLAYYTNKSYTTDPNYTNDWIVMVKSEASLNSSSTIAHEAGHFFSLLHPFNGWETKTFKATQTSACAPTYAADNTTLAEKVSRDDRDKNCLSSGDYMCGTQADYGEGLGWNGGCSWSGIDKDPSCVPLAPITQNIMSYFIGCAQTFTDDQKVAIQSNYANNSGRAYIRAGDIPQSTTPIGTATLSSPIGKIITPNYNNVTLNWATTTGATSYVLEVSQYSSFDIDPRRFVVTSTSFVMNNSKFEAGYLTANTQYFWRVRGFSPYVTCPNTSVNLSGFSSTGIFTTGTLSSVNQIPGVKNFTVQPNPTSSENGYVDVSINTENSFAATIKLFDMNGVVRSVQSSNFYLGLNTVKLETKNLASGIYIISVQSDNSVMNEKLIVTH